MRKQSKLIYTDAGAINIEAWLQNLSAHRANSRMNLLREACMLAQLAGEEHATPNGESCLHQGLVMAEILADLNLDDETLAAGIVYSSVQNADLNLEVVTEHLGENVTKLISGTCQMNAIHALHGKLAQRTYLSSTIDNLRKMLLAMVEDARVILIKLAERLCILHNMLVFTDIEKKRLAQETMDIYAPLANRLGIGHLKWQLEDLSFRYIAPEEYHTLSRGLKDRRVDREQYVEKFINQLQGALLEVGIKNAEVTGRAKHIYSIHRKMQRKKVSLEEIYDAIAFRVLVNTLEECYSALSVVHSLWPHIPKEFDDYITNPKPNGYRSIHTAVEGPDDKFVEIQIRTFEMHNEAELGVAAHWIYKEGKNAPANYEQKILWLRKLMDWQKEMTESGQENEELYSHIFQDRLYVFTPNGDIIDLPNGATPLDFAYQIHSELGHRCRGAKVNGAIVPLTYNLHSGEKVEILTAKQGQPSRDWLNPHLGYLKTSRAKSKVLNWFRKQDYEENLAEGHELLDKELRRLGVKEVSFDDLASKLNFKEKEEMFAALGRGDLRIHNVMQAVQSLVEGNVEPEKIPLIIPEAARIKSLAPPTDIVIEGVDNLLTHLARCCKPIPGDKIIGYVTIGRGISIHREDCPDLIQKAKLFSSRIIDVSWGGKTHRNYGVDLTIIADNNNEVNRDLTSLLANEKIPIVAMSVLTNKDQTLNIHLSIEVGSLNPLSQIISRISQLPNVISVARA